MPIEIDITKIPLYKEGKEEGIREGKKEGKKEGKEETLVEIILNLFKNESFTKEYIAKILNLPLKVVEDILKKNLK